jgi:FkbM family methyltransferase
VKKKIDDGSNSLSLLDYKLLYINGFFNSIIAKSFAKNPLSIIDVGARWGINQMFEPIAGVTHAFSFEPDPVESELITEKEESKGIWFKSEVLPYALSDKNEEIKLYLLKRPNNSSIFKVKKQVYNRYKLRGFELEKEIMVPAITLDNFFLKQKKKCPNLGEIIKLDTQGAEYKILKGAKKVLKNNTMCIICEVSFFSPYEKASNFTDIIDTLKLMGFHLYGFLDYKFRSTKRFNKRNSIGRERLMQADAVFFKDPFEKKNKLTKENDRKKEVIFIASLLLGYFDFSCEILESLSYPSVEKKTLRILINNLAFKDFSYIKKETKKLQNYLKSNDKKAFLELAKITDSRRDFFSYHDLYENYEK